MFGGCLGAMYQSSCYRETTFGCSTERRLFLLTSPGDGHVLDHEMTTDPNIVAACAAAFENAWKVAIRTASTHRPEVSTTPVRQVREALGARLREIRTDANLTGRALATVCEWHFTKISKLEHGTQAPSEKDIRTWCRAWRCRRPDIRSHRHGSSHRVKVHRVATSPARGT